MNKKILGLLCTLIFFQFALSGCWNYQEINELAFIVGAAVDKGVHHKYLLTMEMIGFKTGRETETESKTFAGEGDTILEAMRNSYKISGYMGYWHHTQIVIISQKVAKEGILPILDLLNRSPLISITVYPLISKAASAKEIFKAQSLNQPIRSFQINDAIEAQKKTIAKAPEVMAYQAINALGSEGSALLLPTVGMVNNGGRSTIELSGSAVFKKDKLIGRLTDEETKYVLLLRNEAKGGVLLVKLKGKAVTLKISRNQARIRPVVKGGKVSLQIDLKTQVDIWEVDATMDYESENNRKRLQAQAERVLESNINRVIRKLQHKYDADVLGFGDQIRRQKPSYWRKIKPEWNRIFEELPVNIKAKVEVQGSGIAIKAIQIGGE